MKKKILLIIGLLVIIGVAFVGYRNFSTGRDGIAPSSSGMVGENVVERGRYLATAADCVACHSQEGSEPFSGGHALETPFGKITGGNITPDVETGIGGWSDQDFLNAVKHGRAKGGKFLYPAMPYPNFAKASDEDILAIKAYLDTLPPVKKDSAKNELTFPFNIRPLVMGWNTLFLDKNGFTPDTDQSNEWNRGAYLVEGLAHCGMCHTPKNILGADKKEQAFQGEILQGWYAPEITGNTYSGLGGWDKDDVVEYLKTGGSKHAFAAGPMGEAIEKSLQHLNHEDLRAMVTYLQDQKGSSHKEPVTKIDKNHAMMHEGEKIYSAHCSACHGVEGEGTYGIAPSFEASSAIRAPEVINLVSAVLNGTRAIDTDQKPTAPAMPSFRHTLSDDEIAATLTYIRNSWGNHAVAVNAEDIAHLRKNSENEWLKTQKMNTQ
ncbi:cytochrome c [Bartonella tamiae]|uniref:Cytochrome c domain-containing protein n=1 Tax=Bartonella tamiae Th239 TaxID=1094558 RepID=J0ZLZ0_9HYPH|nr:cytochrome c [Bartonella tamiae]EJF89423.1 hypothetical protein ME5_01974 [Bartonella tamiae Th239]EJF92712.1 hypothetical protein MEG_01882 [Bartonella tamiae Th307]